MNRKHFALLTVLFLLLAVTSICAEPVKKELYYEKKTTLNYPAKYTLRFSLWNLESGGDEAVNMVWEDADVVMALSNPKIRYYLGSNPLAPLLGIDFSQQLWVQVDRWKAKTSTWIPVGSRDRLGVVPFAMSTMAPAHDGKKVGPGLYEVHTRVLWDIGWLRDEGHTYIGDGGVFVLTAAARNLAVGNGMETFLSPLKGYGIPEVQEGATRKVRLYVNYGHQLDMAGTPTVRIGDVEFSLPQIGGHYVAPAANWSNFRSYDEYQHVGHAAIAVWVKDSAMPGWPTQGSMYRIEAHFYDEFVE